ncbi:MAG: multidrug effflux MFS transporter [Opitutaceae bacterium]|jgi:DHA1 family bicyclomycin/chloramphenicol resistance-like MFS transporter
MPNESQVLKVSRRRVAVQLAALSALGPFCIDAYLPSMPDIARLMGVSMSAVQATLTAYMVPFALMTLWHGALSDSLGRKRVVLAGLGIFVAASIGCTFSPSLPWLIVFRALQGATAGVGMVIGRAIVRDLYDGPSAQRLMAMVAIVFAIAPAIAPLIGGWLHHWFGWRSVFGFMGVYSAALLVAVAISLPETLHPSKRQPFNPAFLLRSYKAAITHPAFVMACLATTLSFAGMFLYVLSAPVFLMQHLHVSETGFLWLFGPLTVGIIIGNGLSARLAGHVPLLKTALYGCVVMVISALGNVGMNLLMPPSLPWAMIPLFGYMVGMSLALPSLTLKAIDCFPKQRGLAASCQSFIQSGGSSLLSATAPLFWGTSLRLSIAQLSFGCLCITALFLLIHMTRAEVSGVTPPVSH